MPADLPTFLTSFVGREHEVAEVSARLMSERLLTLVGAGGVGKTRLSAVVASQVAPSFGDGAWFVELAPLGDPDLIPTTITRALGVLETQARAPLDALISTLRTRRALLVLDNCEHLVEACARVVDAVLSACHGVTILATSRQPLNVSGESVWRIPSLATPDAVRLFVDRAQAVHPAFEVGPANAPAVASICQRLDGIPLAIELAAARTSVLAPSQIDARLDDRFRLLTRGTRMAPDRQQTLRATLDWSYQLLADAERAALRSLGIFVGGWNLEAAEAVCPSVADGSTLERLAHLVDASLVQADVASGEARYHLLETLREYAREQLAHHGETEAACERHALFFVRLAERAGPMLSGPEQVSWLSRLDPDHPNLVQALTWCRDHRPADGLRLALGIWPLWRLRGFLREGRAWLEELLGAAPDDSRARADALHAAGELAMRQGDVATARGYLEHSLSLYRALGDANGEASSLERLGLTFALRGEFDEGRELIEAGLSRFRALGDTRAIGWTLSTLGMLSLTAGNTARGRECLEEALRLLRRVGDQHGLAYAVGNLGQVARAGRQYALAVERLEESLELFSAVGDRPFVGWNLANLADVLRLQGNLPRSRAVFAEALLLLRDVVSGRHLCSTLVGNAMLELADGRPERCVALSVAAASNYANLRASLMPDELADWDAGMDAARATLGDAAFGQAWLVGESMTLEQAITYALGAPRVVPVVHATEPEALAPLSRREREVVQLVARGLTNKEIAEHLVVSQRTAEAHVTHALTKLGLRSRAQLAVWAVRHAI